MIVSSSSNISSSRVFPSYRHRSVPKRGQWYRFVSKLCDTAHEALADVSLRGSTIAVGGFGPTGVPETLIDALCQNDEARELTIIALDVGTDRRGVGKLITAGMLVSSSACFGDLYYNPTTIFFGLISCLLYDRESSSHDRCLCGKQY